MFQMLSFFSPLLRQSRMHHPTRWCGGHPLRYLDNEVRRTTTRTTSSDQRLWTVYDHPVGYTGSVARKSDLEVGVAPKLDVSIASPGIFRGGAQLDHAVSFGMLGDRSISWTWIQRSSLSSRGTSVSLSSARFTVI